MKPLTLARFWGTLATLGLLLALLVALSPGIGTQPVGVVSAWRSWLESRTHAIEYTIAFHVRLPRTLHALGAGVTLALCGSVFQSLFRNPLATPYTLGIASGGSLGALLAIHSAPAGALLGFSAVQGYAFLGALAVVAAVMAIARSSSHWSGNAMLLAGVTISFFCSAMTLFVMYLAGTLERDAIAVWMMGSLPAFGAWHAPLLVLLIPCWLVLVAQARPLAQFELGEELAAGRGVNPARLQWTCILAASLATALVVSVCGPIGFVGLIVPHSMRLAAGSDKRLLLPASALAGGGFLIVCDWLSFLVPKWYGALVGRRLEGTQLPIGVMTALIGAPVFLLLLRRKLR